MLITKEEECVFCTSWANTGLKSSLLSMEGGGGISNFKVEKAFFRELSFLKLGIGVGELLMGYQIFWPRLLEHQILWAKLLNISWAVKFFEYISDCSKNRILSYNENYIC